MAGLSDRVRRLLNPTTTITLLLASLQWQAASSAQPLPSPKGDLGVQTYTPPNTGLLRLLQTFTIPYGDQEQDPELAGVVWQVVNQVKNHASTWLDNARDAGDYNEASVGHRVCKTLRGEGAVTNVYDLYGRRRRTHDIDGDLDGSHASGWLDLNPRLQYKYDVTLHGRYRSTSRVIRGWWWDEGQVVTEARLDALVCVEVKSKPVNVVTAVGMGLGMLTGLPWHLMLLGVMSLLLLCNWHAITCTFMSLRNTMSLACWVAVYWQEFVVMLRDIVTKVQGRFGGAPSDRQPDRQPDSQQKRMPEAVVNEQLVPHGAVEEITMSDAVRMRLYMREMARMQLARREAARRRRAARLAARGQVFLPEASS